MAKRHKGFIGKLIWACEALIAILLIVTLLLYAGGAIYCQIKGGCKQDVETREPDNTVAS